MQMKKHNFNAGPAILPQSVMAEAALAVTDFNNSGLSLLEISHRDKAFIAVMDEAQKLVVELLGLDDSYAVLFLSGGASSQFFMVPMNLLAHDQSAAYVDSGSWASKAIKEAKAFGNVNVLGSSKKDNYSYIPKDYMVDAKEQYLHLTSNNTIYGTQIHEWPEVSVPIVCDMSSDIFSRPLPIEKFGLIYAGAQKNMGPAGVTLVVVKKELLGKKTSGIPSMLDYQIHFENESSYNTPPVFPIYVSMLTMRWIKNNGGLAGMAKHNEEKGKRFYTELDANPLFKGAVSVQADRSLMNANFLPVNPNDENPFLDACKEAGIVGLKGHRSVGGFRASMYNALPLESVDVLISVMRDFAQSRG
jgi:phosphoserine aminotransferase